MKKKGNREYEEKEEKEENEETEDVYLIPKNSSSLIRLISIEIINYTNSILQCFILNKNKFFENSYLEKYLNL